MESEELHRSLLYLPPYEDESISHYLGRWYRQEVVSTDSYSLGKKLRLGKTLWRWENFYRNPPPTREQLQKIDELMGLGVKRLLLMFPPPDEPMKPRPIRMCAACYAQVPYHRMSWQLQSTAGCDLHQLRLLSKCPDRKCGRLFPIPAEWTVPGKCKCKMPYAAMAKRQTGY